MQSFIPRPKYPRAQFVRPDRLSMNASTGFPHLREGRRGQYAFLERIVAQTRQLDPTGPVVDNDGWQHTGVTDIIAIHDYSHSGARLQVRYAETLTGGPLPSAIWSGSRQIFAHGSQQPRAAGDAHGGWRLPPYVRPQTQSGPARPGRDPPTPAGPTKPPVKSGSGTGQSSRGLRTPLPPRLRTCV